MGFGLDARGADYRSEHTINVAEGDTEGPMSDVSDIVAKAERSYDPDMRTKAIEFRAWQEAGIELLKAEAALAEERSRFAGRRIDLENAIAAENAGAAPVITRERLAIAKSEQLIAEVEGRIEAARAVFDKEMAEYAATLEGLRSRVAVAHAVVERVELK